MNEENRCTQQQNPPRTDVDDLIFREQPQWLTSDR
jgi:hypothetical protein